MRKATLLVYIALATVAAIAAAAGSDHNTGQGPIRTQANGSFSVTNSREGMPVFTAANIGPGDSTKGTVEIANEGSEAIALTLDQHDLIDTPGSGGGLLSQRLRLKITDLSAASPVYEGSLAAMPPRPLGELAPGASRSYEFTATLPESGATSASDNAVQGASASVAYSWTAGEVPAAEPTNPATSPTATARSSAAPPPPQLRAHLLDYRSTLRNGRIVAWVRCNEACRVRAYASFLVPRLPGELPATAHHAQRRRFSGRTRRLAVKLTDAVLRLLSGAEAKVRITFVARSRGGEVTETSTLLRLRID